MSNTKSHLEYKTVGNVKKEIKRMDPALDENDDAFKAAVIMLYGSITGKHHSRSLQAKTGYPMDFIVSVTGNLRKSGIWTKDGKTAADWNNEESGGVEFWIHVSVGLGFIERAAD